MIVAEDDFYNGDTAISKTGIGSSIKKTWSMQAKGLGFAFGKVAEYIQSIGERLEVAWRAKFYKDVEIDGVVTFGSRAKTMENLTLLGKNPIEAVNDDTPANWKSLGTGYCYISGADILTDSPDTYGIVQNMVYNNEIRQVWFGMYNKDIYHRGGHATDGWSGSWKKVLDENNGIQIDLLWENASPASSFEAQIISVDFSGYTHYYIEFALAGSTYNFQTIPSAITSIDRLVMGVYGWGDYNRIGNRRVSAITEDSISFAAGYYNQAVNNDAVIPIKIYGIKGVQ